MQHASAVTTDTCTSAVPDRCKRYLQPTHSRFRSLTLRGPAWFMHGWFKPNQRERDREEESSGQVLIIDLDMQCYACKARCIPWPRMCGARLDLWVLFLTWDFLGLNSGSLLEEPTLTIIIMKTVAQEWFKSGLFGKVCFKLTLQRKTYAYRQYFCCENTFSWQQLRYCADNDCKTNTEAYLHKITSGDVWLMLIHCALAHTHLGVLVCS